jgi:peptidoglycan/xylan/chitin deacetylase (PgdA/CDA1 family)
VKKGLLSLIITTEVILFLSLIFFIIYYFSQRTSFHYQNHSLAIIPDITKEQPLLEYFRSRQDLSNAVVFTFDDGPYRFVNPASAGEVIEHTGIILDILKKENIKATFFLLGWQLDTKTIRTGETYQKYCEWVNRMFEEGHTIAIHDRGHIPFFKQTKKELEASLDWTRKRIREITQKEPSYYVRSPGGTISRPVDDYLSQKGYKHIFWDINPETEPNLTSQEILDNLIEKLEQGKRGIILIHDKTASNYLAELIKFLKGHQIPVVSLEEWENEKELPYSPLTKHIGKFEGVK